MVYNANGFNRAVRIRVRAADTVRSGGRGKIVIVRDVASWQKNWKR